jgi:hypothetical protein
MCLLWETLRDSPNFNTRGRVARYFPRLALYFRNLMKRKISFIDRLFFAHEKINYFILIEECWKNIPNTCLIERCGSPEARVYWNCRGSLSRKNLRKLDKFVAEDNVSELADLYSDRKITEAQYTRLQAIADYAHSLYQGEQAREK